MFLCRPLKKLEIYGEQTYIRNTLRNTSLQNFFLQMTINVHPNLIHYIIFRVQGLDAIEHQIQCIKKYSVKISNLIS